MQIFSRAGLPPDSPSLLRWQNLLAAGLIGLLLPTSAAGGKYTGSAHGSSVHGVSRAVMEGYSRGNCAHCHEMHASVDGSEPEPVGGSASPFTLFARNFNTNAGSNNYLESDNFCFYCHNEFGSVQMVENVDYSATFGAAAAGGGPSSVLSAFNLNSYHNLKDIHQFVLDNPAAYPRYRPESNPCNACHNPHLAKRNQAGTESGYPLNSAISKPSDPTNLWGEGTGEQMSVYTYESPIYSGTTWQSPREPAGVGEVDGGKTPDYVTFCTDCHNSSNEIWSSAKGDYLYKVDWSSDGERHGGYPRRNSDYFVQPYSDAAAGKSNLVLSCLDCHEPHGSNNIMLLRRQINGAALASSITGTADMRALCDRCHTLNLTTQHHGGADPPYVRVPGQCSRCHTGGGGSWDPIPCGLCHFHSGEDHWAFEEDRHLGFSNRRDLIPWTTF